jgi:hypothetical protein
MISKPDKQLPAHQSNAANSQSDYPTKYDTHNTALPAGSPEPPPAEEPSRIVDLPSAMPASLGCSVTPEETEAPVPLNALPHLAIEPGEGGEAGEGGAVLITNAEFIEAVFQSLPQGAFPAVCSKVGNPEQGGWAAKRGDQEGANISAEANNYVNCSSFYPTDDGTFKARKEQFAACHFLMLDDIGTKVPMELLKNITLSGMMVSSLGNHQAYIFFSEPITDGAVAERLHQAVIKKGLCDAGSSGPLTRWARLPVGINGKSKHANEDGSPFQCRLIYWRPEVRYTPQEIVDLLHLDHLPVTPQKRAAKDSDLPKQEPNIVDADADDALTPKPAENPVITALKARGLYKTPLGSGKHDITCPWVHEHTDGLDTGAAYFEPNESYPLGGFCCQHSHRDKYHVSSLLEFLGVSRVDARHKPVIRLTGGNLHQVVRSAEKELAQCGRYFQSGGLIVSVVTDPTTGNPLMEPISESDLTHQLSELIIWQRPDSSTGGWKQVDPPQRHIKILYNRRTHQHLLPLKGLARQPYFRESDGELITQAGYDPVSQLFGVFDASQYNVPQEPTKSDVSAALALLEDLLSEFHFVAPCDSAAALSAIITAVVRSSLPHAPAFHVHAPVFGSGKTYLCELIGAFAGPAHNDKVSYPTTSEEATKVILALLLKCPAVIEFDDMDTDWIPHGVIKRMLTAEHVTDRILGETRTATVSTRTLFLGSGNNVGPERDLLRRVITIHLDPRQAAPATMTYKGSPVEKVRQNRGKYVSAVLTLIQAFRVAGMQRAEADSIVTYAGAWADYCRYPLMWLGHADPASALLNQIRNDSDTDALGALMTEWHSVFGSTPTTLRKALNRAGQLPSLFEAICDLEVEEKGQINRSKFGRLLKRHANRIVNGFKFEQSRADGRCAWRVVPVESPASPPLPPSVPSPDKNVDGWVDEI